MRRELPLLLAGPILRRSDPTRIHIWVATQEKPNGITASLHYLTKDRPPGPPLRIRQSHETLSLGQYLHASLVMIEPSTDAPIQYGALLGYNLSIEGPSGIRSLDELLSNRLSEICYPGLPLPSFHFHRPGAEPFRFLHGSCRNPNGDGEDALAAADKSLERSSRNASVRDALGDRPAILCLTGDQIYADDLQDELIRIVEALASSLFGFEATVPGYKAGWIEYRREDVEEARRTNEVVWPVPDLSDLEKGLFVVAGPPNDLIKPRYLRPRYDRAPTRFRPSNLPLAVDEDSQKPARRRSFVRAHAGFTTGEHNHLLTLSEYAAMYLLAWNPYVWPRGQARTPSLEAYRRGVGGVRRLLANIPTYMGFDDHEVTDDWNLDMRWREQVRQSIAGRRIIADALAAYFVFQGWGNSPTNFDAAFKRSLVSYVAQRGKYRGDLAHDDAIARSFENAMWDFADWEFATPTRPPVVFLDTRTRRVPDSGSRKYMTKRYIGAKLMSGRALDRMAYVANRAGHRRGQPLILVTPAPVYGYAPAEWVQENVLVPALARGKQAGRYRWDLESWAANPLSTFEFLTCVTEVLRPSYCVILSGDVHYAFTSRAVFTQYFTYWTRKGFTLPLDRPRRVVFLQLTSSSLRYASKDTRELIARKLPLAAFASKLIRSFYDNRWSRMGPQRRKFTVPIEGKNEAVIAEDVSLTMPIDGGALEKLASDMLIGAPPEVIGETNVGIVEVGRSPNMVRHTLLLPVGPDGTLVWVDLDTRH